MRAATWLGNAQSAGLPKRQTIRSLETEFLEWISCGRLRKLWPDQMPVVRVQRLARDSAASGALNCDAESRAELLPSRARLAEVSPRCPAGCRNGEAGFEGKAVQIGE